MDFKMERCHQELPINVRKGKTCKQRWGEKRVADPSFGQGHHKTCLKLRSQQKKPINPSIQQKENQDSEKKENSNMVCFYPLQPVNNFSSSHMLTSGENNLCTQYDGYTGL